MGRPKLLLPCGTATVIERVLETWSASSVTQTVVTVHPQDTHLAELCLRSGVQVVVPETPPADMKTSVRWALEFVGQRYQPQANDAWLLAPADMPGLKTSDIDRVLQAYSSREPRIIVPVFEGRRGHPVLFPWLLAAEVERLGQHEGINRLVASHGVSEVECPERSILDDLDTEEDYARLRAQGES